MCILPRKAVSEMTYTVLGGILNPTHSLTYVFQKVVNGDLAIVNLEVIAVFSLILTFPVFNALFVYTCVVPIEATKCLIGKCLH